MNSKAIVKWIVLAFMGAWLLFLTVMFASADGKVTFYDYRADADVSDQYQLEYTPESIIFDPILFFVNHITRFTAMVIIIPAAIMIILRLVLGMLDKFIYQNQLFKGKFASKLAYNLDHALWFSFLILLTPGLIVLYQSIKLEDFIFKYHYFSWMQLFGIIPMTILALTLIFTIVQHFKPSLRISFKFWNTLRNKLGAIGASWETKRPLKFLQNSVKQLKALLFLVLVSVGVICTLFFFPIHFYTIKPLNMGEDEILLDLHCHTTYSDGVLTPEERVQFYINNGIRVAAFTDHRSIDGALAAKAYVEENSIDFDVLVGQEYGGSGLHINFYGINQSIVDLDVVSPSASYLNLNVSDAIKYVKSIGGYVMVNHYNAPADAPFTYQQLADWGVDGFEIINSGELKAKEIRDFCKENGLICTSATDEHINPGMHAFTRIRLLDKNNRTVAGIFESLKANTPQCVSILMGPLEDQYDLEFSSVFIQYLKDLGPLQMLSWYLWSIFLFGCIFGLVQGANKRTAKQES